MLSRFSVFDVVKKTMLQGFAADACERHWSVIYTVIFTPFVKPGKHLLVASHLANDSLMKTSAVLERSHCYTLSPLCHSVHPGQMLYVHLVSPTAWRPLSSQLPPMEENRLAPLEGRPVCFMCKCCLKLLITSVGFFL